MRDNERFIIDLNKKRNCLAAIVRGVLSGIVYLCGQADP